MKKLTEIVIKQPEFQELLAQAEGGHCPVAVSGLSGVHRAHIAAAMRQAYLEADVFLLPSGCENSPNSLGEAMLLGLPCVASAVGGIPSMLANGTEGLLYGDALDADALARAVLQVLHSPDGGAAMGRAARARALQTHDAARNAADLLHIYESILQEEHP